MAKIRVTHTLQSGVGTLTNTRERIAYAIRDMIYNPGKARQLQESGLISVRELIAEYGHAPGVLCNTLESRISAYIQAYMAGPKDSLQVEVTPIMQSDGVQYEVSIVVYGSFINERNIVENMDEKFIFKEDSETKKLIILTEGVDRA